MDQILYKDKIFKKFTNSVVEAYEEDTSIPAGIPSYHWTGTRIPYELFRQLLSFCRWSQKEHKNEALVYLYYEVATGRWDAWAPPQKGVGMTVSSIPDHKDWDEQRALFKGMINVGTLHHHCNAAAFASSTDNSDELEKDGVHFTIGKCEEKTFDIDVRALFRKIKYTCNVLNWVEPPEAFRGFEMPTQFKSQKVREAIENEIIESMLTYDSLIDFPEFWKTNIIKETRMWDQTKQNQKRGSYNWGQEEMDYDYNHGHNYKSSGKNGDHSLETTKRVRASETVEGKAIMTELRPLFAKFRQEHFRGVTSREVRRKIQKSLLLAPHDIPLEDEVWMEDLTDIAEQFNILERDLSGYVEDLL